jgi:hypothetical protein
LSLYVLKNGVFRVGLLAIFGKFSEICAYVLLTVSPKVQGLFRMTLSPNIGPQELEQYREYLMTIADLQIEPVLRRKFNARVSR